MAKLPEASAKGKNLLNSCLGDNLPKGSKQKELYGKDNNLFI
jgi:hypothetical protein